jgi:predicted HNH restriction endonuclease
VEAIARLGLRRGPAVELLPDEVDAGVPMREGARYQVLVNAYERNPEARRQCLVAHGTACCICGFSFGAEYGPEADGYIHVHHVRPLAEVDGEYVVDPVEDLRPVCPNCHAVLHLDGRCRTIDDVRQLRAAARQAEPGTGADGGA